MTTALQETHRPGLPHPSEYAAHLNKHAPDPVAPYPRRWLILAGIAVSLLWLWVCFETEIFL